MTLAVQVTEDGPWHATADNGRITHCGKKMPYGGWIEYKPARFVMADKWCQVRSCFEAFNKEFM